MRLGLRTTAVAAGACALLSGCFGSGSPAPTAAHTHHRSHGATPSTSTPTSSPTTEPTTTPTTGSSSTATAIHFFPASNGRHSSSCNNITSSSPVDFVFYPVVFQVSAPVKLTAAAVTYADGLQVAGAWVAPSAPTRGTGLVPGWPATSDVTKSSAVQWSQRVPAAGASLTAGTWYNVFLHLRVYPDALPLVTNGVVLTYTDSSGTHTVTWGYHLAFKSAC